MIPKKIHFTYGTEDLPKRYRENLRKWKEMCLDWEFYFYSDEKVYQLFKDHFPKYCHELQKITCGAVLADFFRYAVLYAHGGLYTDIDTIPLRKIPEEWLVSSSVIGYEAQTENWEFFCQWTLLSAPKNPLFRDALEGAFQKFRELDYYIDNADQVFETTGPIFFTSIVKKYRNDPGLLLLDSDYFARRLDDELPFTERNIVQHQFDGLMTWQLSLKFPHIRLNRGCF